MNSKKSSLFFKVLNVVAWFCFIGFCIEAGAMSVNFLSSLFKPELVQDMYLRLDLSELYLRNKQAFFVINTFVLIIAISKAYLFYNVIYLTGKIDLSKPFSRFTAKKISQISYITFGIGCISYMGSRFEKTIISEGYHIEHLNEFLGKSPIYVFMAIFIYIIAKVVGRGVVIQNEIDLTV